MATMSDLLKWAEDALVGEMHGSGTFRFLLVRTHSWSGDQVWWLSPGKGSRRGSWYETEVRGALLWDLQRVWPVSALTGARSHLSPPGIVRLLEGKTAEKRLRTRAMARYSEERAAGARASEVATAASLAWPRSSYEGLHWLMTPHPELRGQTPDATARESAEAMEKVLALLMPLYEQRLQRLSQGFEIEIVPDSAAESTRAFPKWAELASVHPLERVVAHLSYRGRHVAVVTLLSPSVYRRNTDSTVEYAWLVAEDEARTVFAALTTAGEVFEREDERLHRFEPPADLLVREILLPAARRAPSVG